MYRRIAAVALVAGLTACGSSRGTTSPVERPQEPVAGRYAVQPAFLPGVHDAGAMLACELALQPVRVAYGGTEHAAGWSVTGGARLAERLAFHLQAVAYDRCTGRNFERPGK